jgi:hypothetical protein
MWVFRVLRGFYAESRVMMYGEIVGGDETDISSLDAILKFGRHLGFFWFFVILRSFLYEKYVSYIHRWKANKISRRLMSHMSI